jgi:N-acetylglucosaminyldiphosphoundecaprenol N-acetyl-beta-D-mannosaminyltransferase
LNTINLRSYTIFNDSLDCLFANKSKKVINTINAHSYIVAKSDMLFKKALIESDILLPDGEGIVLMARILKKAKVKKIAGADIHLKLLEEAEKKSLKCFYVGSSVETLKKIEDKVSSQYKNIVFGFHSPPFKPEFSKEDSLEMVNIINNFEPDILFIGMTAPKQEKWANTYKTILNANIICSIGAVFDFVAETKRRAPKWVIQLKMEWLYRSFTAWRLTKRYLYSTPLFLFDIIKLKLKRTN